MRGARRPSRHLRGRAARRNFPKRSVLRSFPLFRRKAWSTSDLGAKSGRGGAFGGSSRRNSDPEYDVSQVGRILGQIGWSRQKPTRRSNKRDEEEIEKWKEEEWPRVKKSRD